MKNTKTWISWERNITFLQNKKKNHTKKRYSNADLKISLYVRVRMKIRILELYVRKVCEMFVYKHTEAIEHVKK